MGDNIRRPHQGDLERVVAHFMQFLSNEPDKMGISPRTRFYGMLPMEAKLLFPDVDDEIILKAVRDMFDLARAQSNVLPAQHKFPRT